MTRRVPFSPAAAAAALMLAAAAATVLFTLVTVYRLHVPLPYWDEWYLILHFRPFADGTYRWTDLAGQHNEHRLLFPRLFFFADDLLFGLSGLSNLTVTFALQFVNAGVLIALMVRLVARPLHRALLAGFVLLLLFTLRQEQNFSNGFQLQFVGVYTAAALAAVAYATALERVVDGRGRSAPFFALAGLACAVSAYTMVNGVLTGFALAVAALLARAPARVPLVTLALSGLLAALFFHGYVPGSASLPLSEVPAHAWAYPRYLTAYLGNPIGSNIRATQTLGVLGLILTGAAAWRVATGRSRDGASLALLAIAGFVVASGGVTAYGRVRLGTEQAFESRYATPSLLFWAALVLFWFPVAVRPARSGGGRPLRMSGPSVRIGGLAALMTVLSVASCWFEASAWPDLAARSSALQRVSDSLLSGLYDADAARTYDEITPDEVASFVPFLRAHRLAAFAASDYAALGRSVATLGSPARDGTCDGAVAATFDPALGGGGVRLSGTVRERGIHRAPRRIVVTDVSGTVVGFGSASLPGEPSHLWTAYAKAGPGQVLRAYARLGDGRLCDLGGAAVSPPPAS